MKPEDSEEGTEKHVKKSWLKISQIITTPRHILDKQLKTKGEKKILKAARQKKRYYSCPSVSAGDWLGTGPSTYTKIHRRSRASYRMVQNDAYSRPSASVNSQPQI